MTTDRTTGPKDVFLQLLAMITLYLSATHVGVLLFQLINRALPDPLTGSAELGALRWALATLVIVFPTYLLVTRAIERDAARIPERRTLRTRRWLLHLTLFVAAGLIIGDLVALVYNYLTGELTLRFLFKILTIALIAGVVFTYEILILRRDSGTLVPVWMRPAVTATIAIVAVAVITGFVVVGTPASQRAQRFDAQRVGDLQGIQWQVVTYWQQRGAFPSALDALDDPISGYAVPRDPVTAQPYEYRFTEPLVFEICAVFQTSSASPSAFTGRKPSPYPVDEQWGSNWPHDVGRTCYTRTIDPTRYPLRPSPEPTPRKPFPTE